MTWAGWIRMYWTDPRLSFDGQQEFPNWRGVSSGTKKSRRSPHRWGRGRSTLCQLTMAAHSWARLAKLMTVPVGFPESGSGTPRVSR